MIVRVQSSTEKQSSRKKEKRLIAQRIIVTETRRRPDRYIKNIHSFLNLNPLVNPENPSVSVVAETLHVSNCFQYFVYCEYTDKHQ